MNLQQYLDERRRREQRPQAYGNRCAACLRPTGLCYCRHIHAFDPRIKFVILIHPLEIRRKIATGRMAHLCLHDSELLRGQDFTHSSRLNELLSSGLYEPVVLFPGANSLNLSTCSAAERREVFKDPFRKPLIIVADGTWSTAKKTVRRSQNLSGLPRVCFTPARASQFRVRKQPRPECVSTIEAIHNTLELLAPAVGLNLTAARPHDNLLHVFNIMVEQQLHFIGHSTQTLSRYAQARAAGRA